MLLPNHPAILKTLLLLLHTRSLLAESFSTNLMNKDLINDAQAPNLTTNAVTSISKRSLKDSNLFKTILSNSLGGFVPLVGQSENDLLKSETDLDENCLFRRFAKRGDSAKRLDDFEVKLKKQLANLSRLNGTLIRSNGSTYLNDSSDDVPLSRGTYYKYIIFFARILYAIVCIGKLPFF